MGKRRRRVDVADLDKKNTEKKRLRLLFILTGGTIGTVVGPDGKRRLPIVGEEREPALLTELRQQMEDVELCVTVRVPYQVLSEHMTTEYLEKLADCLRREDPGQGKYDGVIITHGSDTLAFTAAFLGELLRGCPVPVFLLAAQRPIEDPESNGIENAVATTALIREISERISGGQEKRMPAEDSPVYIVYRNSDGELYLHRASELKQCTPKSDDFFSRGMQPVERTVGGYRRLGGITPESFFSEGAPCGRPVPGKSAEGKAISKADTKDREVWQVPDLSLSPDVLLLHPYVGIRYDCIGLEGIRAVLHTLYHSGTAGAELSGFLDRCRAAGIPCYILPCDPADYHYETTGDLLLHGAIPLDRMTEETAYMRLLMRRI